MKENSPPLLVALVPLAFLIILLGTNVSIFGDDALSFSNQIALLLAAGLGGLLGRFYGTSFSDLMDGAIDNLKQAVPALIVLLLIGALAGSWLLSGIVPAMIYYGLKILNPDIFLFASCIICAIVSISTGSSWGTVATVGIALLGIGKAMEIHEGLVAGAIISGAYFGDKMSPLSDTTNLAPAVAGTDLLTHIKYMSITTIPSILISLLIFLIIGFNYDTTFDEASVSELSVLLEQSFDLNPLLFIVPIVVIGLIVKRIPAAPALGVGAILGIVFAMIFQQELIADLVKSEAGGNAYALSLRALGSDFSIPSTNPILAELMSTGGMSGMLNTIWLIICAMIFGGVMDRNGCLKVITGSLLKLATGRTSLIGTTAASSIFMNFTASDQYLAIVVPGKMYEPTFKERGLHPANLSRTLEDAGTVTSVLIPWNTCGATQAGVLGVATAVYWPFCFFCLISPIMTMIMAAFNIRIKKLDDEVNASND
ncbi:MAG: Na+/H+ antiporter NhaC [Flavobacteriales bacterium]|jgi:NhaC family Na+:H+ antiporter|nr:Na+/H+ antiporter NhaC [Flavobacteriales bacterium]MBT3963771.1 Na+/H+ antiporter NhaC [Flavobacteriales bacterium]MBT4705454.1 Na+/H+ antiporter NhaC [Flavobacteriales bacterium]MBT4930435.1 Na+/H+ antiporter NhaC [Flavobacteriales bacterium]MBT5131712.1 Na+/H+ antiporter NhaC [Flavobacteriales bacterium]